MSKLLLLLTTALLAISASADNFAVLIGGSNGYMNYRHHADVCHGYQILLARGIPAANIITFLYDDVANAKENPFPGKLFNAPTKKGVAGKDVYAGCKIDYKGKDVTPANFEAVLTGDASSAPKGHPVLKSTAADKVFVNFVDHGGVGIIAFPGALGQKLYHAADLMKVLKTMHDTKMFGELVFYMEACESGSMWTKLPKTLTNVYATTAANGKESSWGTYCAPHDLVDGKNMNTCLGDLYSVNWMENDDSLKDLSSETLTKQYQVVKKLTNKSHVLQFGDAKKKIVQEPVGNFQGGKGDRAVQLLRSFGFEGRALSTGNAAARSAMDLLKDASAVDSRDIAASTLFHVYQRRSTAGAGRADAPARKAAARALIAEVESRERSDDLFYDLIPAAVFGMEKGATLSDPDLYMDPEATECHRAAHAAYDRFCGGYTDYSLKHVRVVVNMCEALGGEAAPIVKAMEALC